MLGLHALRCDTRGVRLGAQQQKKVAMLQHRIVRASGAASVSLQSCLWLSVALQCLRSVRLDFAPAGFHRRCEHPCKAQRPRRLVSAVCQGLVGAVYQLCLCAASWPTRCLKGHFFAEGLRQSRESPADSAESTPFLSKRSPAEPGKRLSEPGTGGGSGFQGEVMHCHVPITPSNYIFEWVLLHGLAPGGLCTYVLMPERSVELASVPEGIPAKGLRKIKGQGWESFPATPRSEGW